MARKFDTAMNVLGTAAAVGSFIGLLNKKSNFDNKIGEFYSNLGKKGYTKTNRFEVRFNLPPILQGTSYSETTKLLNLRCESASVPGVGLSTTDIMRHGYGVSEKVVNGAQFGGFNCSFIGDQTGDIYKFFYSWMNGIVRWNDKPSSLTTDAFGAYPYEHAYKSEYAANINLLTYNESSDQLLSFDIFEAFPTAIGDIQYNWGDTDNLVRIPVQFAYTYFKIHNIDSKINLSEGKANNLGLIGSLIKAGTAIQTFAALKKPQSVGDVINVVNNAKTVIGGLNF